MVVFTWMTVSLLAQLRPDLPHGWPATIAGPHFDFSDLLWQMGHLLVCFKSPAEPGTGTTLNGAGSSRKQEEKSEIRSSFCSASDILTVNQLPYLL